MMDAISGVCANTTFSKPSTSFSISLPGSGLPLDHIASAVQGTSYSFTAPSDWPQDQAHSDSYVLKQVPLHLPRPDKSAEFTTVKHEHKANKHQSSVYPPLSTPQPQKMSLEKYKEKHAAELAAQKHRQEQPSMESEAKEQYGSYSQVEHRKPQQSYAHGQQGSSSGSTSTSSPLKMKLPVAGQGDKREKGSSLKLRLPVQVEKSGTSKEELKMKIKISSERHSSSDEGAGKSKHSSPLVSKDKHRHHHKHGHSNPHSHSSSGSALKSPMNLGGEAAGTAPGSSSSLRKRTHTDGSHNHHSKKSKSSKPVAGSSSLLSSVQQCVSSHSCVLNPLPFPSLHVTQQLDKESAESRGPEGTNGPRAHYKDSFIMLEWLLSAHGMNL